MEVWSRYTYDHASVLINKSESMIMAKLSRVRCKHANKIRSINRKYDQALESLGSMSFLLWFTVECRQNGGLSRNWRYGSRNNEIAQVAMINHALMIMLPVNKQRLGFTSKYERLECILIRWVISHQYGRQNDRYIGSWSSIRV